MSDVAERVKKIVIEHLGVDADKVVDSANFIEDLGADSLDTVELVMAFEEEFSVEIPGRRRRNYRDRRRRGQFSRESNRCLISFKQRARHRAAGKSLPRQASAQFSMLAEQRRT